MQMKEAWALQKPDAVTGLKRNPYGKTEYVGTHKTGSIAGLGHTAYHKSLAASAGKRVTTSKRKTGETDVYVREVRLAEAFGIVDKNADKGYSGHHRTGSAYKGKAGDSTALARINMKDGKPATARDAGVHAVAHALFHARDVMRGPRSAAGNATKKTATGVAIYGTDGSSKRKNHSKMISDPKVSLKQPASKPAPTSLPKAGNLPPLEKAAAAPAQRSSEIKVSAADRWHAPTPKKGILGRIADRLKKKSTAASM